MRSINDILDLLDENAGQFDFVNTLTAFHRIGVLAGNGRSPWIFEDTRFNSLVGMVQSFITSNHPQVEQLRLLQTIWACAKMGMCPTTTMLPYNVYTSTLPRLPLFEPSQITSLLLAYVHMAPPAPSWREESTGDTLFRQTEAHEWLTDLFLRAAVKLHPQIGVLVNKDLTNVLSAYSKAMRNSPLRLQETEPEGKLAPVFRLFCDLAAMSMTKAEKFTPREMSNAAGAVVEVKALGERGLQDFLTALAEAATRNKTVETAEPQDLSMLVSAVGRANVASPAFFTSVVDRYTMRGFDDYNTQKVHILQATNLTLACLSAKTATPEFLSKSVTFLRKFIRKANLEELLRVLQIAQESPLVANDKGFVRDVVNAVKAQDIRRMSAQKQQRLLKQLSTIDYVDEDVYAALSNGMLRRPNYVKQNAKQLDVILAALRKMESPTCLNAWLQAIKSAEFAKGSAAGD